MNVTQNVKMCQKKECQKEWQKNAEEMPGRMSKDMPDRMPE